MANIFKQPEPGLPADEVPDTLGKFLFRNYRQWPDRVALRQKDFGIWQACNWKACYARAKEFALGLLSLGFQTEDRLIFIGDNEFESYWGMYGTLAVGGVVVGVWVDALAEEVAYYLKDCKPRFALVRDQEQIDKLLSIKTGDRSSLEKAIYWEPRGMNEPMYVDNPWIMSFQELTDMGRRFEKGHEKAFEESIYDISGGTPAAMYYTSGTTGGAKGVVSDGLTPLADLLPEFVANGGQVWLCGACTKPRGITEDQLAPGVKIVGAAKIVETVAEGATPIAFA